METQTLDLRDQHCPLALLLAKREVAKMSVGEKMIIKVTDSGARQDIPRYLLKHGYSVEEQELPNESLFFVTRL